MNITKDKLLGGRVTIFQPQKGYRAAIDPVLLAASVRLSANMSILDLGIGTGAVSLCLKARSPSCSITGFDNNPEYLKLARASFAENGMEVELIEGDVASPPPTLEKGSFDAVVANPPYYDEKAYSASPAKGKNLSHATPVPFESWVAAARRFLRKDGEFYVIFPAARKKSFLLTLEGHFSEISLIRLLPKAGNSPKRLIAIAKGQKETRTAISEVGSFVLHLPNGDYTLEAHAVLWEGQELTIV